MLIISRKLYEFMLILCLLMCLAHLEHYFKSSIIQFDLIKFIKLFFIVNICRFPFEFHSLSFEYISIAYSSADKSIALGQFHNRWTCFVYCQLETGVSLFIVLRIQYITELLSWTFKCFQQPWRWINFADDLSRIHTVHISIKSEQKVLSKQQ